MSGEWTIAAILGALGLAITVAGLISAWAIRINKGERGETSAQKAHNRIDTLAQIVNDFRQEVARDYASNRMIEQMEGRLVTAIERLGDRLDRAFEVRKP